MSRAAEAPAGAAAGERVADRGADGRSGARTVGTGVLAVLVAGVTTVAVQAVVAVLPVPLPTASTANTALTTLAVVGVLAALGASAWLLGRHRRVGAVGTWVSLSALVTVVLAVPLGSTRLYLGGVSVDQQFRTQLLTRLTDSPALSDMNYAGLAPFYPSGWFWVGGRLAALAGLPGWEAYKPWAIGSLAVAAVAALVAWSAVLGPRRALVAATASAVVLLGGGGAQEPYGAVVSLLAGPALVLAWRGLRARRGGRGALLAAGVFLGLAATSYTLYFGVLTLAVVVMAVVVAVPGVRAGGARAALPVLGRLVVVGVPAALVALTVWAPYVLAVLSGEPANGVAQRFLPAEGTTLPLPMAQPTLVGLLCLVGTVWLVLRARSSDVAAALGLTVVVLYAWTVLSLAWLLFDSTLLGFRLLVPLESLLAAAGGLGLLEAGRLGLALARRQSPGLPARVRPALAVLGVLLAVGVAQAVPGALRSDVALAYTDPGADGVRAAGGVDADAATYPRIDALLAALGPRRDTVVLTGAYGFLAYYPYRGFQQVTPHYANPHADYVARREAVQRWAGASSPAELLAEIDASPWPPPTAFVLRADGDRLTLDLARDTFPDSPNVVFDTVAFPRSLFSDPAFTSTAVGPFVVVTRRG
ncbi:galactan 5-O-arabinofuranosyltransferase [Rhodococcus aerolatus]